MGERDRGEFFYRLIDWNRDVYIVLWRFDWEGRVKVIFLERLVKFLNKRRIEGIGFLSVFNDILD